MRPRRAFAEQWSPEVVLKHLVPLLTDERWRKIQGVVAKRTYHVAPVLENIYDRGNTSAVMRTAEALGLHGVHIIEHGARFKAANRVTAGADKWLDVERWTDTPACLLELKKRGYQVLVTTLGESKSIEEVDFSQPTAIVLGNEKDGVSAEALKLADQRVHIPMHGFVQSFNISVAGALSLYRAQKECEKVQDTRLSATTRRRLEAELVWACTTRPEAVMESREAKEPKS
jgi:tRNA (guanosine-2'-O-)-methyltransferase